MMRDGEHVRDIERALVNLHPPCGNNQVVGIWSESQCNVQGAARRSPVQSAEGEGRRTPLSRAIFYCVYKVACKFKYPRMVNAAQKAPDRFLLILWLTCPTLFLLQIHIYDNFHVITDDRELHHNTTIYFAII